MKEKENVYKIKLLKLYELLRKETDPEHPISRRNLNDRLIEIGIPSNVRTLSKDIAVLIDGGFEISSKMIDKEKYYYVPEPDFSFSEVKILIDALMAANFIPKKMTKKLVGKVVYLCGNNDGELLESDLIFYNNRKHTNENIMNNVNTIEKAILDMKKVAFYYFDLDANANRVFRNKDDGEKKKYYVEPVALLYNEDNYYLMSYSNRHPETTTNYRVDRMDDVEIVFDSNLSDGALDKLNTISQYTEQVFKMYNGNQELVTIEFDKTLLNPVFDKFGEEIKITQKDSETLSVTLEVQVSPTFFGWLSQFSDKMKIVSPIEVKEKYYEHIKRIIDNFK